MSVLVREEIELAKAEVTTKVTSIARGAAAVAVGAVFGVFALVFVLLSIAWAHQLRHQHDLDRLRDRDGASCCVLTAGAFLFAWRKLKVGAPKPQMAMDEAKKIRATISSSGGGS